MNDFEHRLHDILREATEPYDAPHLVGAAHRRAVVVRRRRAAAGGAAAAAAVVASGVAVAQRSPGSPPRVLATLTAGPATSVAPALDDVRVTIVRSECRDADVRPLRPIPCARTTISVERPNGAVLEEWSYEGSESFAFDRSEPAPAEVEVVSTDGTSVRAPAREDGVGRWVADLRVAEATEVVEVRVFNRHGHEIQRVSEDRSG